MCPKTRSSLRMRALWKTSFSTSCVSNSRWKTSQTSPGPFIRCAASCGACGVKLVVCPGMTLHCSKYHRQHQQPLVRWICLLALAAKALRLRIATSCGETPRRNALEHWWHWTPCLPCPCWTWFKHRNCKVLMIGSRGKSSWVKRPLRLRKPVDVKDRFVEALAFGVGFCDEEWDREIPAAPYRVHELLQVRANCYAMVGACHLGNWALYAQKFMEFYTMEPGTHCRYPNIQEAEDADQAALREVFRLCYGGATLDDALATVAIDRDMLRQLLQPRPKLLHAAKGDQRTHGDRFGLVCTWI